MHIYLFFAVLFGIWAADSASRKGRSATLWGIFGVLIPIVTNIIIWMLPISGKLRRAIDDELLEIQWQESQIKTCPYCINAVHVLASVCPHCRSRLPNA